MADSLLPFAFTSSRQDEHVPLSTSSQHDSQDESDAKPHGNHRDDELDSELSSRRPSTGFLYSALNSSSSVIIGPNGERPIYENTSSTILNFENHDAEPSSDIYQDDFQNQRTNIPSSPMAELQQDAFFRDDKLRSDAFDDLVATQNSHVSFKQSVPSSPTLITSQLDIPKFNRPSLGKHIHSISRHGSTFAEPSRKKQRQRITFKEEPLFQRISAAQQESEIEFAIDRDGLVYGYHLEKAELPANYSPSSYDEPTYFVVKNSAEQETKISKIVYDAFDQVLNPKNPILVLDLQNMGLNSLPDSICDIKDCYHFSDDGLIKPINHINASNNMLRSINPKLFTTERLEMLSLRNNKIARLSGNIDKAHSLKELNLSMNKLKFLPHNILKLNDLEVLAVSGNPMIPESAVDKYSTVDVEILKLYSTKHESKEFLDSGKQIKAFSKLHWMTQNKQISKQSVRASILSRSLTTLQDMCIDSNGLTSTWNDSVIPESGKLKLRSESQSLLEHETPNCPRLSEIALKTISDYRISQREISQWKEVTSEFIYKRVMNSLIYGTNGETCGFCYETCVESVAEMLEWWDFKGSQSVTIKRRFCSKNCAYGWRSKLNNIRLSEKK